MKRCVWMVLLASVMVAAGCGENYRAKQLVQPDTTPGRMWLLLGSTESRLGSGQIDFGQTLEMPDGTPISVWAIKSKTDKPYGTYVLLHGRRSSKANPLPVGQALAKKGYDVVLMDLRAHGESGGEYTTYGYKEKNDVKNVVDRLLADGVIHRPFYAFGETLGATTAIQWAAIDDRVKAVAADAPYKDFVTRAARKYPLLSKKDLQKVVENAEKLADFQAEQTSSIKAARQLDVPLLVMNGFFNASVPVDHAEAVAEAAGGPVEFRKKLLDRTSGWLAQELHEFAQKGVRGNDEAEDADQRD